MGEFDECWAASTLPMMAAQRVRSPFVLPAAALVLAFVATLLLLNVGRASHALASATSTIAARNHPRDEAVDVARTPQPPLAAPAR